MSPSLERDEDMSPLHTLPTYRRNQPPKRLLGDTPTPPERGCGGLPTPTISNDQNKHLSGGIIYELSDKACPHLS